MIVQKQICLSQHLTRSSYFMSGQCSGQTSDALKMTSGAVTLFFFAASLTMASDSSTRPWARSHRGDSGISLGFDHGEKGKWRDSMMSLNQFTLDLLVLIQIWSKTLLLLLLLLVLEYRLCYSAQRWLWPPCFLVTHHHRGTYTTVTPDRTRRSVLQSRTAKAIQGSTM